MPLPAYLAPLLFPVLVLLSFFSEGWWTLVPVICVWGLLPLIETAIGPVRDNPGTDELRARAHRRGFSYVLYLHAALHFVVLGVFLWRMGSDAGGALERTGWILAMGINCGTVAINIAHELGHKRRKFDQRLAKLLLTSSFWPQFFYDHNRGHHVKVGTPEDATTARLGESLFAFLPRAMWGETVGAWRLSSAPLRRRGKPELHPNNEILRWWGLGAAALIAVALTLGWGVAGGWLLAGLIGVLLLETVDYIEHYGLTRERLPSGDLEPVNPTHSWNSDFILGRVLLVELVRHSDHHANAARPYQSLRSMDGAPQHPLGYPGMMVLAACPPLWFRVMHPRIASLREHKQLAPQVA
jgi:alkane 1-monooxygenase